MFECAHAGYVTVLDVWRCYMLPAAAGLPGTAYTPLQSHFKYSITSIRGTSSLDKISDVTELKVIERVSEFADDVQK